MATLVLGLAGAALGSSIFGAGAIGGLGITGAQLGFFVGSSLGGLFGSSETIKQEGARLSDLKVQTSSYGAMIPIYYGTERGAGNVIWSTELRETATTTEQDGGGKGTGGGQSVETTIYTYSASFAVSICDTYGRTPRGLRRVWANNLLILDFREDAVKNKNFDGSYRLYMGDENQLPSSLQEAYLGVGNVPAYRGQMVIEFEDMQLEKFGNRIPSLSFEVVMSGDEVIPNPTNVDHTGGGTDIVITSGGLNPTTLFAFKQIDDDTISFGNLNIETNTFDAVNTVLYSTFPASTIDENLFTFDLGAAYVGYISFISPLTNRIEKLLSNKVWKGDVSKTHYFDAASYTYLDTLNYVDYGVSSFQQNTFGSVYYNEKSNLIYIPKQNFVLANSYMEVLHPDKPEFFEMTGQVVLTGPEVLGVHTGIFGNDIYAQIYFDADLLVGYRATSAGSNNCPYYVYKLDQLNNLTLLFNGTIKSDQDNGVTCFYDEVRNRLVFITRDATTNRLLATYFAVQRTPLVVEYDPINGVSQTYDNDYTVNSTPVEVYLTDADGEYIENVDPEPNFGGLTDAENQYYFSLGGSGLGKTYNINPDTFVVTAVSASGAVSGVHNRSGLFSPVYTEPAFIYKNQAITMNQETGISRVTRSAPITSDGVSVASVVSHLSSKVGLDSKIDVSELEADFVHGYKIAQVMTARAAIETLQRVYSFDSVESTA